MGLIDGWCGNECHGVVINNVSVSPCTRPSCVRNSHICIKADVFLWTCQKSEFHLLGHDVMRKMIDVFLMMFK